MAHEFFRVETEPKHQTLFILTSHGWPSSDSEDSDYEPGKEVEQLSFSDNSVDSLVDDACTSTRPPQKRRRRRKKTTLKSPKLAEGSNHHTRAGRLSGSDFNGSCVGRLPTELWMKIFQFVVTRHGPLPFLCRAARVCREWHDLAMHPSLWHQVDLSYGWIKSTDRTLKWLAQNNLSQCREISLSGWKNVTNDAFLELCENCPNLESVNVTYCHKLSSVAVSALARYCPKLKHLDLSNSAADTVSVKSLKDLAEKVGSSLRELILAGNYLVGFNLVMNAVMSNCPHLDTLDLSNCVCSADYLILNVEKLQESCPSLRILRLANCQIRANQASLRCQGVGFVKLQELSCAMPPVLEPRLAQGARGGVNDSLLVRLLHKANSLKLLDLRGCLNMIPSNTFVQGYSTHITDLEQLYLSRSSISRYMDSLRHGLQQWRHSLQVLDMSWTTPDPEDMEEAIEMLTDMPSCPLTHLHLAGSTATLRCVILALKKLKLLESLDLTSCRALPRGIKCLHSGAAALHKLRVHLKGRSSDSDTDSY